MNLNLIPVIIRFICRVNGSQKQVKPWKMSFEIPVTFIQIITVSLFRNVKWKSRNGRFGDRVTKIVKTAILESCSVRTENCTWRLNGRRFLARITIRVVCLQHKIATDYAIKVKPIKDNFFPPENEKRKIWLFPHLDASFSVVECQIRCSSVGVWCYKDHYANEASTSVGGTAGGSVFHSFQSDRSASFNGWILRFGMTLMRLHFVSMIIMIIVQVISVIIYIYIYITIMLRLNGAISVEPTSAESGNQKRDWARGEKI